MRRTYFLLLAAGLVSTWLVWPVAAQNFLCSATNGVPFCPVIQVGMVGSQVADVRIADFATADDGMVLENPTAATVGITRQDSPNLRFVSHGYISGADHTNQITTVLKAETSNFVFPPSRTGDSGHTLSWYSRSDANTVYEIARLQGNGNILAATGVDAGMCYDFNPDDVGSNCGDLSTHANSGIYWRTRTLLSSPANSKMLLTENNAGHGIEFNVGTADPTIASGFGTSPSINANSNNAAGVIIVGTGGTAASGVVTFGSPAWTNAPICHVTSYTAVSANVRAHGVTSTTTTMTVFAATAWPASAILAWTCMAQH